MKSKGLDFFPFDVDFFDNEKIALIEAEFGHKGVMIAIRLLCKIYKEGYYCQWGGDECLLFSRKAGAGFVPELVGQVVAGLVKRSMFDEQLFNTFGILTSFRIQTCYFSAIKRRQGVGVRKEFLLVDVSKYPNVYILGENVDISCKNVCISKQSKSKKKEISLSKEKDTKKETKVNLPAAYAELSLEECFKEIMSEEIWAQDVLMAAVRKGYKLDQQKLAEYVTEFFGELKCRGETSRSLKGAKEHFSNWLNVKLEKLKQYEKRSTNGRGNYTSKQEANDYALSQFLAMREAREQGVVAEVAKPF